MTHQYCQTCSKFVTNKWAIIGDKHVGCPKAKRGDEMIKTIIVKVDNENDWVYEIVDAGNGIKRLAVF